MTMGPGLGTYRSFTDQMPLHIMISGRAVSKVLRGHVLVSL